MFQRIFARSNLAAVALLGFLLVPKPAAAQQGWHLYEWAGHWGRFSGNYPAGYEGLEYSVPSYYMVPNASPNGPLAGYQSFYQPAIAQEYEYFAGSGAGEDSAMNRAALINLSVPADAEIWFDDAKTTQSGAFRQFVSPPLIPGRDYFYEVKAKWTEDGKEVTQNRRITVHAGDVSNVSFSSGAVVNRIP